MEPPKANTPDNSHLKDTNFIEDLIIKQDNKEYKIQFGINNFFAKDELAIKVCPNRSKEYYFNHFNLDELQKSVEAFMMYKNIKEIISFLKESEFSIVEGSENLILKFNFFLPNGKQKASEIFLKQYLLDSNEIINNLFEENKLLTKIITKNTNDINLLKEENKKLWDEINKLKDLFKDFNNNKNESNLKIDSKIVNSISDIEFILNYIKENDKLLQFNNIKLLYRGSRDGDKTEICHKLCDEKKNIIILMVSDYKYIFGGYCKIGFKANKNKEVKVDNNCFIFSINLRKIFPVIKNQKVICDMPHKKGLCFYSCLGFFDNFLNNENSFVCEDGCEKYFEILRFKKEINGGKKYFKCQELEVFQLLLNNI